MRVLTFIFYLALFGCASSPSYKYAYSTVDTEVKVSVSVSVSKDISKVEASEIIEAMQAVLKENEFVYSIASYNGNLTVNTTIGIPDKSQLGKSGSSYSVFLREGKWVIEYGGIWIS